MSIPTKSHAESKVVTRLFTMNKVVTRLQCCHQIVTTFFETVYHNLVNNQGCDKDI